MDDVHSYRCTFFDKAGKVVGFDAHDFSDDAAACRWALGLNGPPATARFELRDDARLVHEATLATEKA